MLDLWTDGSGNTAQTPGGWGFVLRYIHPRTGEIFEREGQGGSVNGNKLDNRRENLRPCTMVQNQQNLHQCGPYRGASWDAENRRWRARVKLNGKQHCLGRFATQAEAAAVAAAFRRTHMPFSADAREAV